MLAAADPAQPYGAALPWPKRAGARAARVAGAQVVLLGQEAALFVERGGRTLVPLREPDEDWLRPAIAALVEYVRTGGAKRLAVERFDGHPVIETEIVPLLVEAGFLAGPPVVLRLRADGAAGDTSPGHVVAAPAPPTRTRSCSGSRCSSSRSVTRVIDSTDAALRQSSSAPSRVASVQDDSSSASAPRYTASQPSACSSTASIGRTRGGAHAAAVPRTASRRSASSRRRRHSFAEQVLLGDAGRSLAPAVADRAQGRREHVLDGSLDPVEHERLLDERRQATCVLGPDRLDDRLPQTDR